MQYSVLLPRAGHFPAMRKNLGEILNRRRPRVVQLNGDNSYSSII